MAHLRPDLSSDRRREHLDRNLLRADPVRDRAITD